MQNVTVVYISFVYERHAFCMELLKTNAKNGILRYTCIHIIQYISLQSEILYALIWYDFTWGHISQECTLHQMQVHTHATHGSHSGPSVYTLYNYNKWREQFRLQSWLCSQVLKNFRVYKNINQTLWNENS